jgi:periplasmic divalent cation tolerance protein
MTGVVLIYCTFPTADEARALAEDAVERRLAACANIFAGVTSIYEYNGAFANSTEHVVVFKTTTDKQARAMEHIKAAHSYAEPALMVVPVTDGDPAYLRWIKQQTA